MRRASQEAETRPGRGRPPKVDREMVVEAAIKLADEDGLDALSLRAVAARLGVAPMTLYGHVENADELLALVASDLIKRARRRFPELAASGDSIARWAYEMRALLKEHPVILEALMREPIYSEGSLEAIEEVLEALDNYGFEEENSLDLYTVILAFVIGFTALETRHDENEKRRDKALIGLPRRGRARERVLTIFDPERFEPALRALTDLIENRHT